MSLAIRIALIIAAVALLVFVLHSIRKAKLRIENSLFWVILSIIILLLAVFPGIATECSRLLKFQAPINFVFLVFIAILLLKSFRESVRVSQLEMKLEELTQKVALNQKQEDLPEDSNEAQE